MTTENDFLERFQKYKTELLRATSNSILESTIQFFYDNKNGEPAGFGSGFLIRLADRYFMVTAAHVIAEYYNKIYVILPSKELQLGGKLHFTPMPASGTRDDDNIDIAVMELDDSVVADLLVSFKFTTIENIELGHKSKENQYYLSIGYPGDLTKIENKVINAIPFPYQTEFESNFDYKKTGFSDTSHIAVKFDGFIKSESNPIAHPAPRLGGISGSGLWFLKDFATPNMIKNKQLVGIVTTLISHNGSQAIIATRIDLVTEFIRQHFNLDIPKSPSIKVNIK